MNNSIYRPTEQTGINFKEVLLFAIKHWYLFLLSIIICIIAAKLYLKYTPITFGANATLLLKDDKKKLGAEDFIEGMELLSVGRNIQNEVQLINSFDNVKRTLKELNFEVSYFVKGNIKTKELYANSPFEVKLDTSYSQIKGVPIYIKPVTDSTFALYVKQDKNIGQGEVEAMLDESIYKYGELCRTDLYSFVINKVPGYYFNNNVEVYFVINDINLLTQSYISRLKIELINKHSSIINLSIQGLVPEKEVDFLNKISDIYIQSGLEEKNLITVNTIKFIDAQLEVIIDSLKGAEYNLEKFRSSENVMDISSAGEKAFEQLDQLEKERAEFVIKDRYYNYLLDYVNYNYDIKKVMAPSAIGIEDPLLNKLILDLHTLNSEKASASFSIKDGNPTINVLDLKIENTKKSLIENLKSILAASKIALNDNKQRLNRLQELINRLPGNERRLVNIQRKFSLNDNIYNYLMEKRMEAGIAKAANAPDCRVINRAMIHRVHPVAPQKTKIFIVAGLVAFLIPGLFILLKLYVNDSVVSKEMIERNTEVPIIGTVSHFHGAESIPIVNSPKSAFSESIRSLRVNLQYLAAGKNNKIFGVTSSVSGEGKTFFSCNLAASIALSGAKVLLIGADLRKPKIHQKFDLDNSVGLSSYLIGKAIIEDIIKETVSPNLYVIPSGPVPPNPTELLESSKTEELINLLLSQFEYIIIDAPPVGIVADYYLLSKYTHANLYLLRQNYSKKYYLKEIQSIHQSKKLSNLFLVFNDYKYQLGYGYSNYYGNGNYGYYQEETNYNSWRNKLINLLSWKLNKQA